jgi:lysyl endopeptidase
VIRTFAAALLACSAAHAAAAAPTFEPDLASLRAVPRVELPAAAVAKALAARDKGRPYQYAVPVDFVLRGTDGSWALRDAGASWRLRLRSPDARSLSLHLPHGALPAGATLWVHDTAAQHTYGPFDTTRAGGAWTPPLAGDELVVEVRSATGEPVALEPGTIRAFHGYRDWKSHIDPNAGAGACNIDITCPSANAWTADGGAVARISIGGAFLCSGQLVNNVRQDKRRLFLTANHCGIGDSSGPDDSVMFYFNYTGACGDGDHDPLPAPTFQGSSLLARDVQSDFALVEISDGATPLPAGVFFAGWDATGDVTSGGASIHHPSGDEKKIAFHDVTPVRDTIDIGFSCRIDAWRVQWTSGTTEGGSSGGGLWDNSHRLIGVLTGGLASCGNPTGADYYSRLERAWTANAAASGQLKAHLDPDGSCVAIVPRLDPATSPGPVAATPTNQVCAGPASSCGRRGGGGGGGFGSFGAFTLLGLLGAALKRIRA